MNGYWITFTDGTKGYCQGSSAYDAKIIAEHITGKTVGGGKYKDFTMDTLPYPANPIIWQLDHPVSGKTPAFCFSPEKCKGNSCCHSNPSCTS
jgi:hypothetical protein